MKKLAVIVVILVVAVAGGYFALRDGWLGPDRPDNIAADAPVSGSVQNFTAFDEPKPMPDITFVTETGEEKTIADLGGRVVLVNFWATYCGPCVRELPSLETLARELGDEGLTVALMSQDHAGWEQINEYLSRLNVATPESYLDVRKRLATALGVSSLPVTALVDAEGNILGAVTGPAEWDTPEAYALIRHFL